MAIEEQYRVLGDMDILKDIIEPINSKTIKTTELADKLNITTKELKEHIKANGYVWRGSQYTKALNGSKRANNKMDNKSIEQKVKVTYRIDKELQRLVKLQSIIEDTDNSTIIEKAIRSYVSKEAYTISEQIKNKNKR
jgi:hypothetical protein